MGPVYNFWSHFRACLKWLVVKRGKYSVFLGGEMRFRLGIVLTLFSLSYSQFATAGHMIVGSEGLSGNGATSGTLGGSTDITKATSITWTSFLDTANKTGDFTAVPDYLVISGSSTLSLQTGTPTTAWTIHSAAWGTFTETSISSITKVTNGLNVYVDGTFTPGTDFDSSITGNTAQMVISINQAGGAGHAISTGATLTSPDPAAVPEPAGVALVLSGVLCLGVGRFFRRKNSSAQNVLVHASR